MKTESEARDAFGELVKRYQNAAIAYAYAILRNHAGAEDAAQAAFLTAWLRRADLREPKAFGSWLRTIVRTECCRISRRMHLATVPLDDAFGGRAEPSAGNIRDPELQHLLLIAIEALPDSDRTVIALRYVSDFSYQEMCDFLEIPLSTVKKRLYEARRRLRAKLTARLAKHLRACAGPSCHVSTRWLHGRPYGRGMGDAHRVTIRSGNPGTGFRLLMVSKRAVEASVSEKSSGVTPSFFRARANSHGDPS